MSVVKPRRPVPKFGWRSQAGHWRHVICAVEWYPYESGYPLWAWGTMPRAKAYILQSRFSLTGRPVQRWQTLKLIRQARRFHPQFIFTY